MILQSPLARLKKRADRVAADARISVGRADGRLTWPRATAAYVAPAVAGALVLIKHPAVQIGQFLSGASIVSGVLLALCTLSFNRVKDLAAEKNSGWDGIDPMRSAYRFARNTLSAAYVSIFATGLLIVQLFITEVWPARIMLALTIGLISHLGVRIWFLLGGIRNQVEAVAGQRSAERPRLRNAS